MNGQLTLEKERGLNNMPSSIRTDRIKRFNTSPDDINIGDIWLINFPSTR